MRSLRPNPVLLTLLFLAFGMFVAVTLGPPAGIGGIGGIHEPAVSTYTVVTDSLTVADGLTDSLADGSHAPPAPRLGTAGPGLAILFTLILLGTLVIGARGSRRCRGRDDGTPGAAFGITFADRCLLN